MDGACWKVAGSAQPDYCRLAEWAQRVMKVALRNGHDARAGLRYPSTGDFGDANVIRKSSPVPNDLAL